MNDQRAYGLMLKIVPPPEGRLSILQSLADSFPIEGGVGNEDGTAFIVAI
jgi:hypothetical protein